jgi:hypothetical protein
VREGRGDTSVAHHKSSPACLPACWQPYVCLQPSLPCTQSQDPVAPPAIHP